MKLKVNTAKPKLKGCEKTNQTRRGEKYYERQGKKKVKMNFFRKDDVIFKIMQFPQIIYNLSAASNNETATLKKTKCKVSKVLRSDEDLRPWYTERCK